MWWVNSVVLFFSCYCSFSKRLFLTHCHIRSLAVSFTPFPSLLSYSCVSYPLSLYPLLFLSYPLSLSLSSSPLLTSLLPSAHLTSLLSPLSLPLTSTRHVPRCQSLQVALAHTHQLLTSFSIERSDCVNLRMKSIVNRWKRRRRRRRRWWWRWRRWWWRRWWW